MKLLAIVLAQWAKNGTGYAPIFGVVAFESPQQALFFKLRKLTYQPVSIVARGGTPEAYFPKW